LQGGRFKQINSFLTVCGEICTTLQGFVFGCFTYVARHTNATLLLSLDVPIETVSKLLGHSDIKTTQIYAKVIDKNKRDAVSKLDGLTD